MTRFAQCVLRHRLLVSFTWLVLFLAGGAGAGAGALAGRLSLDFSLPGQPGYETEQKIIDAFGASASSPTILTVSAPPGQTLEGKQADVASAFDAVTTLHGVRLVDGSTTGSELFTTSDARTAYALVYLAPPTDFRGGATYLALPQTIAQSAQAVGLTGGGPATRRWPRAATPTRGRRCCSTP